MAGASEPPYRLPCHLGAWPATPVLNLCNQFKRDFERNIQELCNSQVGRTPLTNPAIAYQTTCAGTLVGGNCYSACAKGTGTGILTDAGPYPVGYGDGFDASGNPESLYVNLTAGVGTIKVGDIITFAGDATQYRVTYGAEPGPPDYLLAGYYLQFTPGLAVAISAITAVTIKARGLADFSACTKTGWKAVRSRRVWQGTPGFTESCGACPTLSKKYLSIARTGTYEHWVSTRNAACVTAANDAYATCSGPCSMIEDQAERDACYAACEAAKQAAISACPITRVRITNFNWQRTHVVSPTGVVTRTACVDNDGGGNWMDETGQQDADNYMQTLMFGYWQCGPQFTGNNAALLAAWFTPGAPPPGGGFENFSPVIVDASNDRVELTLNDSSVWQNNQMNEHLRRVIWELEGENTLASVAASALGLLNRHNLANDAQHPWRRYPYVEYSDGQDSYHLAIPLVEVREIYGEVNVLRGLCVSPLPDSCAYPCGPAGGCEWDGAVLGDPLTAGMGVHYGFYYKCPTGADRGWPPGYGLPATATWWTVPYAGAQAPSNAQCSVSAFPPGGWVMVQGTEVIAQKWAETRAIRPSVNFARPCGADSRAMPGYHPVCGRVTITTAALATDTHILSLVLAEATPHLQTGDRVDFVQYAADFVETLDDGDSKLTPDSDGYEVTRVDDPHFTIADVAAVPSGFGYLKSHGAPHFRWHDDKRKGDLRWTKTTETCLGFAGASTVVCCEDGCTSFSPCYPQVAAVLPPNPTEAAWLTAAHVDVKTLPTSPANAARVWYFPTTEEADPFGTADLRVESRCSPPPGAAFTDPSYYRYANTLPGCSGGGAPAPAAPMPAPRSVGRPVVTASVQTVASASAPVGGGCCGQDHPALTTRMAVGGAVALAGAALGLDRAEVGERDRRRGICAGCEFARGACVAEWLVGWLGDQEGKALGCCTRCRCYLWAKTETAGARCPEGKW